MGNEAHPFLPSPPPAPALPLPPLVVLTQSLCPPYPLLFCPFADIEPLC